MISHWNNCTPIQPWTFAMRDRANELWAQAACMADANEVAQKQVYPWADIEFLQFCASELERWSLAPIGLAYPPAECDCNGANRGPCEVCAPKAEAESELPI